MANLVLHGFEPRTAQDLAQRLTALGHFVAIGWRGLDESADALFCDADSPDFRRLAQKLHVFRPDLPVIAATANPDQSKWLDALEAGAADYCCAPFESSQLAHLLAGVLGRAPKPSALEHV